MRTNWLAITTTVFGDPNATYDVRCVDQHDGGGVHGPQWVNHTSCGDASTTQENWCWADWLRWSKRNQGTVGDQISPIKSIFALTFITRLRVVSWNSNMLSSPILTKCWCRLIMLIDMLSEFLLWLYFVVGYHIYSCFPLLQWLYCRCLLVCSPASAFAGSQAAAFIPRQSYPKSKMTRLEKQSAWTEQL